MVTSPASAEPMYSVQVNMSGCAYDIRVNDGPLYENVQGFPLVVELPANRWIRNGANEISFHLTPAPGATRMDKECHCTAVVYVRDRSEDRESRREVAKLEYPGPSPVTRLGNTVIATGSFVADVPYPVFRWFTSGEIAYGEETRLQLVKEVESFHALLEAKNLDALAARVLERDKEDAAALYRSLGEQVGFSRRDYSQFFDEAAYTLRPARTATAKLRIFGNGRLARLDLSNGQSPVYYLTADRQTAGYVGMVFCLNGDGKWMVIR